MPEPLILVLANAASTLFLAGVIWFVQLVHYPLFARVGPGEFVRYENEHAGRTTWVVAPAMLLEAATSGLLMWWRPAGAGFGTVVVGFVLVCVIWASTFAMQVPLHARLTAGFEPRLHRGLVLTNWVRTMAWTARAWLVMGLILQLAARGV